MSKYLEQVMAFQENKRNFKHNLLTRPNYEKVTTNGEISYDTRTDEYVVYEETYAHEVGRTSYPKVAVNMLETYAEEYLDGNV
ncbi:coil containing protein [Vibrio phage 1.170.O._10N.261.52.C3]|nr:coil containing protein [Vibrio phage 1.170.O._10N.261.52.C3]